MEPFVGFFNVTLLTFIPRNRPILVAFYDMHGIHTEDAFSTYTPPGPQRGCMVNKGKSNIVKALVLV